MLSILNPAKKNYQTIIGLAISFLLISCGTYQNASYGDDGIYSGTAVNSNPNEQNRTVQQPNNSNTGSYFSQKIEEYDQQLNAQNGNVLTDVEGYSSNNQYNGQQQQVEYYDQPEWGANAQANIQTYANWGWGNNYYPY